MGRQVAATRCGETVTTGAGDVSGSTRVSSNRVLQVVDERLRNKLCFLKGLSTVLPPRLWKGVGNVNRMKRMRWVFNRVKVGVVDSVCQGLVVVEVEVDFPGAARVDPRNHGLAADDIGARGSPPRCQEYRPEALGVPLRRGDGCRRSRESLRGERRGEPYPGLSRGLRRGEP